MSKYDNTNVPHINELLKVRHISQDDCDYCDRGWSKGFHTCPSCGTECPPDYFDDDEQEER